MDWLEIQKQEHTCYKYNGEESKYSLDTEKRVSQVNALLRSRIKKGSSVLDVGCWVGMLSRKLVPDYSVWGMDFVDEFLGIIKKRGIKPIKQDIREEWKTDMKFDAILLGEILEHAQQPLSVLAQAKKHLKEGGFVFITVPNGEHLNYRNKKLEKDHYQKFTIDSLKKIIEKAGFDVDKVQGLKLRIPRTPLFIPFTEFFSRRLSRTIIIVAK